MRKVSALFAVAALCVVLVACVDARTPLSPTPHGLTREIAPDGGEAPKFTSLDEVPEELGWAEISNAMAAVFWDIETADAIASMDYWANRASIDLSLSITHGYSTVGTREAHWKSPGHLLARPWRHGVAQMRYTLARDCGQTADLQADRGTGVPAWYTRSSTRTRARSSIRKSCTATDRRSVLTV